MSFLQALTCCCAAPWPSLAAGKLPEASPDTVGQTVVCRGTARNSNLGASIATHDGPFAVCLEGKPEWEADILGKRMTAVGLLEARPVGSDDPGSALPRQTVYVLTGHGNRLSVQPQSGLAAVVGGSRDSCIGNAIAYCGIARDGKIGPYVDGRGYWPMAVHIGNGRKWDPGIRGRSVVARGTLRRRMIGSDNPRVQMPRQALYYMEHAKVDLLPEPHQAFDPEAVRERLAAALGGEWWVEEGRCVGGRVPVPGTERRVGVRVIPYPYSHPTGKEMARLLCCMGLGPLRVIGSSECCTALLAISAPDHPLARGLSEVLDLSPVQGPTTCEEFAQAAPKESGSRAPRP